MARLSLYLALATFLSLLSIGGFVLYSIIRHEPNFYKTALLVANDPNKGDTYLKVDAIPSRLYKYNGKSWIHIDKDLSDNYTYDTAYIDYLIAKVDSGEYDPDLLSDLEQEQIAIRLNHDPKL